MKKISILAAILFAMSASIIFGLAWGKSAYSAVESKGSREALLERFHKLEKKSPFSIPGISAYLDSYSERNISGVDIYGVLEYPYDFVEREMIAPINWCNIVILHPNIRACTYLGADNNWRLVLFNSDRAEQLLADASPIEFRWDVSSKPGYFDILMSASEGPFSTTDHHFGLEATARDERSTVVHLSYSYEYGALTNIFMKSYFAIFSRSKVGFSETGTDDDHHPVYIKGIRGLNERNVVRYYLAVLAYLDTRHSNTANSFEVSLARWFDLASRYKRQLMPGEKKDYIAHKKRDYRNQQQLQEAAGKPLN